LSLIYNNGLSGIDDNPEFYDSSGFIVEENVTFTYTRGFCLNSSYRHDFQIFKKSKLSFEVGYSLNLYGNRYEIVGTKDELTDLYKSVLKFMDPGGILFSIDYGIGF
jgi:hypothetical protein